MINEGIVTVIGAFGGGLDCFKRHLPIWKKYGTPIFVFCPEDDPMPQSNDYTVIHCAGSQPAGWESIKRLKKTFQVMIQNLHPSWSHIFWTEYDGFWLDEEIPKKKGMYGCRYSAFGGQLSPNYAHPPWIIDRESFEQMWATANKWPDLYENGAADWYLSALAFLSNIPIISYQRHFTCCPFKDSDVSRLQWEIHHGARAIHGIKTKENLNIVRKAYLERHVKNPKMPPGKDWND